MTNDVVESVETDIDSTDISDSTSNEQEAPIKPLYPLADNALTTVERACLMLGIDEPDQRTHGLITLLINRASAWVEQQMGRHLGKKEYVQKYEADGQQELVTLEYPIIDVEYVMENNEITDPELYDYERNGNIGIIYKDTGWLKSGYRGGLAFDIINPTRAIEVSYTAGYILPKDATEDEPQTLPMDIEGLVWDMIGQLYTESQNGSQGLSSFSIADVTWVFDKTAQQAQQNKIINLYKRL